MDLSTSSAADLGNASADDLGSAGDPAGPAWSDPIHVKNVFDAAFRQVFDDAVGERAKACNIMPCHGGVYLHGITPTFGITKTLFVYVNATYHDGMSPLSAAGSLAYPLQQWTLSPFPTADLLTPWDDDDYAASLRWDPIPNADKAAQINLWVESPTGNPPVATGLPHCVATLPPDATAIYLTGADFHAPAGLIWSSGMATSIQPAPTGASAVLAAGPYQSQRYSNGQFCAQINDGLATLQFILIGIIPQYCDHTSGSSATALASPWNAVVNMTTGQTAIEAYIGSRLWRRKRWRDLDYITVTGVGYTKPVNDGMKMWCSPALLAANLGGSIPSASFQLPPGGVGKWGLTYKYDAGLSKWVYCQTITGSIDYRAEPDILDSENARNGGYFWPPGLAASGDLVDDDVWQQLRDVINALRWTFGVPVVQVTPNFPLNDYLWQQSKRVTPLSPSFDPPRDWHVVPPDVYAALLGSAPGPGYVPAKTFLLPWWRGADASIDTLKTAAPALDPVTGVPLAPFSWSSLETIAAHAAGDYFGLLVGSATTLVTDPFTVGWSNLIGWVAKWSFQHHA